MDNLKCHIEVAPVVRVCASLITFVNAHVLPRDPTWLEPSLCGDVGAGAMS